MISYRVMRCVTISAAMRTTATTTMMVVRWSGWKRRGRHALAPPEPPEFTAPGRSGPIGVIDAEPGGRHGLEPGRLDCDTAHLAPAVGAVLEAGEGLVDLVQGLLELSGQG